MAETRIAHKVWLAREAMPAGTLNHYTSAPPKWFHEPVKYAAELFGLELGIAPPHDAREQVYTVLVLDTQGATHEFKVTVRRELTAHVQRQGWAPR